MALKDRLSNQWKGKTTVEDVVDAIEAEADALIAEIDTAITEKQIDNAGDAGLAETIELLQPHTPGDLDVAITTLADTEATRRLALGIAAANRSWGSIDAIINAWDAMTFDLGGANGLYIRVQAIDYAEVEIQIPHTPAPLDNATFRAEVNKILCRAAGPGITCTLDTTAVGSYEITWVDTLAGIPVPTTVWTFQESGLNIADQIGTDPLTTSFVDTNDVITYQVTGEDSQFATRFFVDNIGGDEAVLSPASTTFGNVNTGQLSFYLRFRFTQKTGAVSPSILAKQDATEIGWRLEVGNTGGVQLFVNDGTNEDNTSSVMAGAAYSGNWLNIQGSIDRVNDRLKLRGNGVQREASCASVTSSIDVSNALRLGLLGGINGVLTCEIEFAAMWIGHILSNDHLATLDAIAGYPVL